MFFLPYLIELIISHAYSIHKTTYHEDITSVITPKFEQFSVLVFLQFHSA